MHVWDGAGGACRISRRETHFCCRVFHESLLCGFILRCKASQGRNHRSGPGVRFGKIGNVYLPSCFMCTQNWWLFSCAKVFITYFSIKFEMSFFLLLAICYAASIGSTAIAVMVGCVIEDRAVAQEFLPALFVPQLVLSGFFVATDLIPSWIR